MISHIRPSYSVRELWAALRPGAEAVRIFERDLATRFGVRHAIAFPYGRSALHACLRAMHLAGGEVVQPAYNCVAVAHACVKAGCPPVFVDAQADSPNQNPEEMVDRIGPNTVAVLPTSALGVTFDARALCAAIRARNPSALIVLDCCLCFDARWDGDVLATQGDAAVLAFGVEKPMTTLCGGALITNRDDVADAVRGYRDATFRQPTRTAVLRRWAYFVGSWVAYCPSAVGLVDWLKSQKGPIGRFLPRGQARETIALPPDNDIHLAPMQAAVGHVQLARIDRFIDRRREIARRYFRELADLPGVTVLRWDEPSPYTVCAARVEPPDARAELIEAMRRNGVLVGTVWNYVVPGLPAYEAEGYTDRLFPHARHWAETVITLPNMPTLADDDVRRVIGIIRRSLEPFRGYTAQEGTVANRVLS